MGYNCFGGRILDIRKREKHRRIRRKKERQKKGEEDSEFFERLHWFLSFRTLLLVISLVCFSHDWLRLFLGLIRVRTWNLCHGLVDFILYLLVPWYDLFFILLVCDDLSEIAWNPRIRYLQLRNWIFSPDHKEKSIW